MMNYEITPSAGGDHIILTVRGEINRRTAMAQNVEAHALGRKLGVRRYLVDLREARYTDTLSNQFEFAYDDMQQSQDIDRLARVAVVVDAGDRSHDFFGTIAANAGLNVRLFNDLESAREFLKST